MIVVGMCHFPEENQQPIWVEGSLTVFRRKVAISIGRETKTHILSTKRNETSIGVTLSNNECSFRYLTIQQQEEQEQQEASIPKVLLSCASPFLDEP